MKKVEQKISPAGFARFKEHLLMAENEGHGPDTCARIALTSVGLSPEPGTETVFVVDYSLDGPIFPFMEWPAELAASP